MNAKKKGIIGTIVLIIIALIVLGYYNISIKSIIESPFVKENLLYAWDAISSAFSKTLDLIVYLIREYLPSLKAN